MNGLFITGTGTEVGKTLVTTLLAYGLQQKGQSVCPLKPVATGAVMQDAVYVSEDTRVYRNLVDIPETPQALSHVCLKKPASPHFAATLENKEIAPEGLYRFVEGYSQHYSILLVEGIGGWLVPLAPGFLVADFARQLKLPVLIVAANRLGAINHTLMTIATIRGLGIDPAGVVFTQPDADTDGEIAENNRNSVKEIAKVEILGDIPYLEPSVFESSRRKELLALIQELFAWEKIWEILSLR